jgi:HEAT repeat protein
MKKLVVGLVLLVALAGGGVAYWVHRANDPERRLAAGIARIFVIRKQGAETEKALGEWRVKNEDAFAQFFFRFHELGPREPASHEETLRAILAHGRPELVSRLERGDLRLLLKDDMPCSAQGRCPRTPEARPAADPAKECAEFVAEWLANAGEREALLEQLKEELEKRGKEVDALAVTLIGKKFDNAFLRDPDAVARVRSILERYEPAAATEFAARMQDLRAERVASIQRDLDYLMNELVAAEDRYHSLGGEYWVQDVSCLYRLTPQGRTLQLISRGTALADAAPLPAAEMWPAIAPESGDREPMYRVLALGEGQRSHPTRFAFTAFPAKYGADGRLTLYVDESGVVWVQDLAGKPAAARLADPASAGWSRATNQPVPSVGLGDKLESGDAVGAAKAVEELARLGERGKKALSAALGSKKAATRGAAASGVLELQPWARRPFIPDLLALLSDPDPQLRAAMIQAAPRLLGEAPRPDLLKLLSSSDAALRSVALDALIQQGVGEDLHPALLAAHGDPDPVRRLRVSAALAALKDPAGEKGLVQELASPDPKVRLAVVSFLARARTDGAAEALVGALGDADDEVRKTAGSYLVTHADDARPALVAGARDAKLRAGVARLVLSLDVDDDWERSESACKISSRLLRALLEDESDAELTRRLRVEVVRLVGILIAFEGLPDNYDAANAMVDKLKPLEEKVEEALVADGAAAAPVLLAGFRPRHLNGVSLEAYGMAVGSILSRIGAPALPAMIAEVESDPNDDRGYYTAQVATKLLDALTDEERARAAPVLVKAVRHWKTGRHKAIEALAATRSRTDEVLDALIEALGGSKQIAVPAAEALAEWGPSAKRALKALEEAEERYDPNVKKAAREAIEKIGKKDE